MKTKNLGAFHSTKYSGLKYPNQSQVIRFQVSRENTRSNGGFFYLCFNTCFGAARRRLWSWNKRCSRWGWQYHFYRMNLKGIRDYIYGTSLSSWRVQESLSNDERAVHSSGYANISRSSVFWHSSLKLERQIHCNNVAVRYFSRLVDRGPVLCLEAWGSAMLNSISRLGETRPEREWSNGTEFSGYSDFPEF